MIGILFGDRPAAGITTLRKDIGTGKYLHLARSPAPSLHHCLQGQRVPGWQGTRFDVLTDHKDRAIVLGEEDDGRWMRKAVVKTGPDWPVRRYLKWLTDVRLVVPGVKVLSGGNVPVTVTVGTELPADILLELQLVVRIDKPVVVDGREDEACVRFAMLSCRFNETSAEPGMADVTGIGCRVDSWSPAWLARPVAVTQRLVLGVRERGGLLDDDDVVLETEVLVDIRLVLEVTNDDPRSIRKDDQTRHNLVLVAGRLEDPTPEILKLLASILGNTADVEDFQLRLVLTGTRGSFALLRIPIGTNPDHEQSE